MTELNILQRRGISWILSHTIQWLKYVILLPQSVTPASSAPPEHQRNVHKLARQKRRNSVSHVIHDVSIFLNQQLLNYWPLRTQNDLKKDRVPCWTQETSFIGASLTVGRKLGGFKNGSTSTCCENWRAATELLSVLQVSCTPITFSLN